MLCRVALQGDVRGLPGGGGGGKGASEMRENPGGPQGPRCPSLAAAMPESHSTTFLTSELPQVQFPSTATKRQFANTALTSRTPI